MADKKQKNILKVLEALRRKLLDTGTRNRLVHVNRAKSRANCLNVVGGHADEVFSILLGDRRKMRFKAMGEDRITEGQEALRALPEADTPANSNRLTDGYLETPLGPEALARRLLRLATDARTAEEEQGLNILYLAIGFLTWRESASSEVVRESPLVLLPVELVRNERASTFDIIAREDDISTNLPLQERLRQDFGIQLPEVDETEELIPTSYFQSVREAVCSQVGWSIDEHGMQVGFFSFAKLLMHRDLDPGVWQVNAFAENELLRGLLADGFEESSPIFGPEDKLDDLLDPAQIIQVIDADASQTKAIEEVRRGANLVVQGPPGTGKSQTITNLIAAAAHDGKSVLFVAEKMAALSVVHARLVRSGLRDICLELHSRTANKKALAQELARTLNNSSTALPGAVDPARLRATRDELNQITALLHHPLAPGGETPFRAISEIVGHIGKGAPPPSISLDALAKLDLAARSRALGSISKFVAALGRSGAPKEHPFRGTIALNLQPTDLVRLQKDLADAIKTLECFEAEVANLSACLALDHPDRLQAVSKLAEIVGQIGLIPDKAASLVEVLFDHCERDDLVTALQAGSHWRRARDVALERYREEAFDLDTVSLAERISVGAENRFVGLPSEFSDQLPELRALRHHLESLIDLTGSIAVAIGVPVPQTPAGIARLVHLHAWLQRQTHCATSQIRSLFAVTQTQRLVEALDLGENLLHARRASEERFVDAAWSIDPGPLRTAIAQGAASFLSRWFGGYRKASNKLAEVLRSPLPAEPAARLDLITELAELADKRKRLSEEDGWLRSILAEDWQGERTAFADIRAVAIWMAEGRSHEAFATADELLSALSRARQVHLDSRALAKNLDEACTRIWLCFRQLRLDEPDWEEGKLPATALLKRFLLDIHSVETYHGACADLTGVIRVSLPPDAKTRIQLVAELQEVQRLRAEFGSQEDVLRNLLGDIWTGVETPFDAIAETLIWLQRLKAQGVITTAAIARRIVDRVPNGEDERLRLDAAVRECGKYISVPLALLQLDLVQAGLGTDLFTSPFAELRAAFARMATETSRYVDWASLARAIGAAKAAGAGSIVDAVLEGRLDPSRAGQEFAYACAEARWTAARAARPALNLLPELDRHDLVTLFRDLEKQRIEVTKTLILSRHFDQMPRGTVGEMSVIRGEIGRKKGHKPIRWVMRKAGSMVQRIKPVMLMSPISVAQFLPPGEMTFDLLVIDEASQIKPEDALGVIARARQIVVVGDQKQLPPTSFFDRLVDDAEESDEEDEGGPVGATAADMESILSLCEARGLRQRMLEWHYRSRVPSLIRVSNAEFYGDRLVLPPSPLQLNPDYGLKFRRVPGVYARGGSGLGRQGTNRIEAEALVKAMADHARVSPDLSLGAVAFSKAQAEVLTEVLELHRRRDPVLDAFLREGKSEDVFVKNIENVQGDERDVILISVGYGPQEPNGRLAAMTFGPVNSEGGERRLNVLFSRARVRCEVFASFDPGDIDSSRVAREGPRVLKRFLDYAKTGIMENSAPTGLEADSPFEEDVAAVITSFGFLADAQVGSAGFRIDIGVRHPDRPGQYLVAVECDGAAYHSALWARERDRLRQDILENLGWNFHRIWSTDWFHHRKREIERLRQALDHAREQIEVGIRVRGTNHAIALPSAETPTEPVPQAIEIGHLGLKMPAYVRAEITVKSSFEPHEAPVSQLADLVAKIVAIEGPIHIDEVARRITSAFGRSRAGSRIVDATAGAVRHALHHSPTLTRDGPILMTLAQAAAPPVRDRSAEPASLLNAALLPPCEIAAAAALVRRESGDVSADELTRAIARLLGFRRVGNELFTVIAEAIFK
jgi:hypothetical protein